MLQTAVLASGSKGNCILVRTAQTTILIDAGISVKRIFAALQALNLNYENISAVVVSHEHSDHISSIGAVSRTLKIPIYITKATLTSCRNRLGNTYDRLAFFRIGESFKIRDIVIHPFYSSHDAIESCNFVFSADMYPDTKLALVTDVGFATNLLINRLQNCSTLILESNHDEKMLLDGPYDWHLKQRIRSIQGHLSNVQAVGVVSQIMHPGLRNLVLAHLSEVNNHPELALQTMKKYLEMIKSDTRLYLSDQYSHTELINV